MVFQSGFLHVYTLPVLRPVPVVPNAGVGLLMSVFLIFIILVVVQWYCIGFLAFISFVMKHTFNNFSYVQVCVVIK